MDCSRAHKMKTNMAAEVGFENLDLKTPLSPEILAVLSDHGYHHPTPVQSMCIPLMLSHKDVVAEAVTGSGKTLAFLIPVIETLLRREEKLKIHEIGAMILTPTRELSLQISSVVSQFAEKIPLTHLLVTGGKKLEYDLIQFKEKGAHIVVATAGKLCKLLEEKSQSFPFANAVKSLEVLVLDEADRMLGNPNFERDLNTILSYLPKQRRTSLFSATQTDKIEMFIRAGLRNPVQVVVKEKSNVSKKTPDTLKNYYLPCEPEDKFKNLISFLRKHRKKKHIVFFNTCASVDYFSKLLEIILKNISVISIHGQMKNKRINMFQKFKDMNEGVLCSSDVMARGIDIPEVDWVVQYDPPSSAEAFVHRCGRTARIGNIGNSVVFLLPNELPYTDFISVNQKVPLEKMNEIDIAELSNLKNRIQKMACKDRDLYEKAKRAFVSYIQSYRKHECSLIFQVNELDITKIADSFGLVHLPKMPELKNVDVSNFVAMEIDAETIPYKEKAREERRQRLLADRKNEKSTEGKRSKKSISWSKSKEKKAKKQAKSTQKRKREKYNETDLEDVLKERSLLKKLKKGKLSEDEFEKQIMSVNDDESD